MHEGRRALYKQGIEDGGRTSHPRGRHAALPRVFAPQSRPHCNDFKSLSQISQIGTDKIKKTHKYAFDTAIMMAIFNASIVTICFFICVNL